MCLDIFPCTAKCYSYRADSGHTPGMTIYGSRFNVKMAQSTLEDCGVLLSSCRKSTVTKSKTKGEELKGRTKLKGKPPRVHSSELPSQAFRSAFSGRCPDHMLSERESLAPTVAVTDRSHLKLKFEEKKGNLFSCPKSAGLAHCVSKDLKMSKGIAVTFKETFKGVQELAQQDVGVGGVAILQRDDRFVYYLITKTRYFHKPTYKTLRSSLECMKAHIVDNSVAHLCIPRIGCGLDRLEWEQVSEMIQEVFHDVSITITVYSL